MDRVFKRAPDTSSLDRPVSTPVKQGDVVLGMGFRAKDDPCRFTGETKVTAPLISRESNLVSCPIDYEGRGRFAIDSGAIERVRTDEYVVYTVPIP